MIARRILLALGALSGGRAVAAEPLRVLSGGALEPAVAAVLPRWRGVGGGEVTVTYATAPRIAERLAGGERPDVLLAPVAILEGLERSGGLASPPVVVGSVAVGIAVRDGAAVPAIADEASLRAELAAVEAVIFNRASTGLYMDRLFERLGLTAGITPKAVRFPDGDAVLRRLAAGMGREIAFAAATEIALFRGRGVRLVGPLPEGLGNVTTYAAGIPGPAGGAEARRFVAFLGSGEARAAMAAAGVE